MNLALWLERAARRWPDAPALLVGDRMIANYRQFADRSASLAGALRARHGIEPGDRIAIFLPNCTDYLILLYASWYAGAVVVPINAKLHTREAAWIIKDAGAKIVLTAEKNTAAIGEHCAEINCSPDVLAAGAPSALGALAADAGPADIVERGSDDIAWLFYTSGTTGTPKGVMISHGNLHAMAFSYFVDVDEVKHTDAALYAAPMSHGAGIYNFMHVMRGARHVISESGRFDAAEVLALAPRIGNVSMFAAPTMVARLVAAARETGSNGEGLRTIVYGGGPMYLPDITDALDVFGARFVQIYGQGECPMAITALAREILAYRGDPRWPARAGSVGLAQSCVEVRVADENGRSLPPGESGDILVRGTPVMLGYWNNPNATAGTIRDGWLVTGDVGRLDEDGFLTLMDRSKDVIISGGTNIYPREVEEALLTHAAVTEVSVVGSPDPDWGEHIVAFVVADPQRPVTEAELDAHCLDRIARFKRPKRYVFVGELPKNNYGKVLKTALREQLPAMSRNVEGVQ